MARAARALAPQLGSQSATLLNTEGGAQSINRYLGNDEDLTAGYNAKRELYGLYEENDAVAFRDAYSKYANTLLQGKEIIVSKTPLEKRKPPTSAEIKEGERKVFINKFYESIKENKELFGLGMNQAGVFTGIIDVQSPGFNEALAALGLSVEDVSSPDDDSPIDTYVVRPNGTDKAQKFNITQGMSAQAFVRDALQAVDAKYDEAKNLAFLGDLNPEREKVIAQKLNAKDIINKFSNKKSN